MAVFSLSYHQNPWWESKEKIKSDSKIVEYQEAPLKWQPSDVFALPREKGAVHMIFGPRQIGKSTALKLLVQKLLLEENLAPKSLFYFNCDAVADREALIELVTDYLEWTKTMKQQKYIFLDEISSVKDWPFGIKWLIDSGFGRNITFFLTGSTSLSLKKSGEYLPGRRGKGKDLLMCPLSFFEFFTLFYPELQKIKLKELKTKRPAVFWQEFQDSYPDLQEKINFFFISGGFPKVINDFYQRKQVSPDTVNLYQAWVRSALAKAEKKEFLAKSILQKLFTSLTTGVSYQGVAQFADLGSHNTARDYLEFLKETFLILEAPFFDIHQKKHLWRKNKKYYFLDPFIFWLLSSFISGVENLKVLQKDLFAGAEGTSKFIENLVATELYKNKIQSFYFSNKGEVDFVFEKDGFGIEVKYQDKVVPADYPTLRKLKKGIVVSKKDFYQEENVFVIPLQAFLLLYFPLQP
ncbi:MAG: ATP-binding protein [Candidatus Cloacimonetes bacterium]|nr:ATP-binding protein [Candidatus Cloacimonadota bacterium]